MGTDDDALRMAMEAMVASIDDIDARLGPIRDRLTRALKLRDEGSSYSEMGSHLDGSPVIAMLGEVSEALIESAARLRRAAAFELYDEGMTMDQIAERFGVTRQRVSAILREARSRAAQRALSR